MFLDTPSSVISEPTRVSAPGNWLLRIQRLQPTPTLAKSPTPPSGLELSSEENPRPVRPRDGRCQMATCTRRKIEAEGYIYVVDEIVHLRF